MRGTTRWSPVAALWLALVAGGCAGYTIRENGTGDGYDVYRPEPYLLVTPGAKGPDATIVWLPNFDRRYRVDTWNVLGKADFTFAIEDGWRLERISDQSDNTRVPAELIELVKKSIRPETLALSGSVQLFRIVYGNDGTVRGLKLVPFEP
jgi:hypothetical protein